MTVGGYPGKLRELLGIWVEESDALPETGANHFTWEGERYPATILCDLLHSEGAEVHAVYEEDFYAGMPVLTSNAYGKGKAWYLATRPNAAFYEKFLKMLCDSCNIAPIADTPDDVEAVLRENETNRFLFLLNHAKQPATVTLPDVWRDALTGEELSEIPLPVAGVRILEREKA